MRTAWGRHDLDPEQFRVGHARFASGAQLAASAAFFAHVGGFVFGVIVARVLVSSGTLRAGRGEPAAVGAAP
jgi:hypothetical protein